MAGGNNASGYFIQPSIRKENMISLSVQELKPALAGLTKVVSGKHQLPCLRCIRVDATPERVTLMGTDLDMYARFAVPEFQCVNLAARFEGSPK